MNRTVPLKWYRCPLCNSSEFEIVYVNPDAPVTVSPELLLCDVMTSICARCGLVQSNPRPSPRFINRIYKSSPSRMELEELQSRLPKLKGRALAIREEQASYIDRVLNLPKDALILDIGCNNGVMLSILKRRGYNTWGIEPDLALAAQAQKLNGNIITAFYQNFDFPPGSFDVITAFHVLEHIHDPRSFLRKARRELKPDGHLVIEVPDLSNPNTARLDDYFNVQHIFNFTPTSLSAMLEAVGFEPVGLLKFSYHSFRIIARKASRRKRLANNTEEIEHAKRIIQAYKVKRIQTLESIAKAIYERLQNLKPREPVVVWGAGKHAYDLLRLTPLCEHPELLFVDSNPKTHKAGFMGLPVFCPDELPKIDPKLVVISSYMFQREIESSLRDMGFEGEKVLKLYDEVRTYDGA
ncbi:MAG TPA: class I SAM-dependent methyltransferase [Proteobacteria bacterium]|nr:class I SAM-dependent methyltransferase [Pseudomonadota bacterium]